VLNKKNMIRWAPFPFVRIVFAFIAGILLAFSFPLKPVVGLEIFVFVLLVFIALYFIAQQRKSGFLFSLSGIAGMSCFIMAGWTVTEIRTAKNDPDHLLHKAGEITHYSGFLNDFLLEKPTNFQTTLQLQKVRINGKWQAAEGLVQISFRKEKGLKRPSYGNVLVVKGSPKLVSAPLNPGQFDYRKYLATHNIYHQQYLYPGQFTVIGQYIQNPAMALSIRLRQNLDKIFRQLVPTHREYGIASALVLGIKDELDNEIKATYSNTGTMHVLAVSGLHVGLVFSILSFGLKRMRSTIGHRIFSAFLVLSIVWAYAFITALSPSVLRAAVMFTFVMTAQVLQRRPNMYNTLAVTAFVLLCFNPYFLLDVGFQLSFLAVIAIVYLQPRLYKLLNFDGYVADKVWALTCVSLSTIILYVGLAVLFFGWVPYLGMLLGKLMQGLLWIMNEAMIWLERLPVALINRIPFSGLQAILFYGFILLLLVFMARPKLKFLTLACCFLGALSFIQIENAKAVDQQKQLVIFSVPNQTVWAFLGPETTVLADSNFLNNKQAIAFNLEPSLLTAGTKQVNLRPWNQLKPDLMPVKNINGQCLLVWRGKRILALSAPLKQDLKTPLEVDYLVLQKNVWISAEKLQRNFRCRKIIFDSSNSSWFCRWLGKQLQKEGLPYHDVAAQGAFKVVL
jgi:competence protein ComEC